MYSHSQRMHSLNGENYLVAFDEFYAVLLGKENLSSYG
jgi:hypothetical protein